MRPILLPDPPSLSTGVPEIFEQGGAQNVVRRAVVIGNGFPGSENQCIGLVRALGLAENPLLYVSFDPFLVSVLPFPASSFFFSDYLVDC